MTENYRNIRYINYEYMLEEMKDSMEQSISNVVSVVYQQMDLINYLEKANNSSYAEFIQQLKDANVQYNEQIKVLRYRLDCLSKVIDMIKNDSTNELSYISSMLMEAFGVANKEANSVDDRDQNKN